VSVLRERYPAIMYDLSAVGTSAAAASEALAKLASCGTVDQVAWKQIEDRPDLKPKGDKRNGTMSRQQAFGKLFGKERWSNQ
jgi:hypothetical protein